MPAWTSYDQQPDGRYRFVDDQGGELYLLPSPSVDAVRAEIDARNAPPAAPMATPSPPAMQQPLAPAAMPDPVISMQGPPQTMRLASDAPDPNAQGASGNAAPPAPEPAGAGGAPQAPPPSAQGQGGAPSVPATPGAPAPTSPIVRGPGGSGAAPGSVAADLWYKAAEEEAKGSPGMVITTPGGTFETGKTVQFAPGPDPGATRARERAEKKLGDAQSDLIYVEARKQQEQAELAQAEAARAQERQRQLAELQARQQEKLAPIFEEIDAKRKDLAASKVDPDNLIKEMSSGRQALLGVAMALGGFGKALAGEDGPPMAMQLWKEAVANDIANQKYAIEKKRGDISSLGQVYQLAKERFDDERMAQDAAYLAGLEVYKAKILKTVAEADAAMGVETQYDENGQIVAGAPYSMRAKAALAALGVEQAKLRENLSQQANGQVAQQFVTTQDKTTVVGGKKPNWAKSAEYAEKGDKAAGGDGEQQQVNYNGQQYKVGKFVSPSEGAEVRKKLNLISTLRQQIAKAQSLRNSIVGVDPMSNSEYVDTVNTIAGMRSVLIEQGVLQGNEREEFQGLSKSILSGADVLKNIGNMSDRLASGYMDQLDAKPMQPGGRANVPQGLKDAVSGKKTPGAPIIVGGARQQAAAPPSAPVVRASGAKASPLDRTGAAVVQASTAGDDKAKAKAVDLANRSLREALAAKQIGPGEYKVALQMAKDGQYDELLDFLGRMRGTVSTTPQPITPEDQAALARSISAQVALGRVGLTPFQTQAGADRALGVGTTTISTKIGKAPKGGGAPAVKAPKLVNLSGKGR